VCSRLAFLLEEGGSAQSIATTPERMPTTAAPKKLTPKRKLYIGWTRLYLNYRFTRWTHLGSIYACVRWNSFILSLWIRMWTHFILNLWICVTEMCPCILIILSTWFFFKNRPNACTVARTEACRPFDSDISWSAWRLTQPRSERWSARRLPAAKGKNVFSRGGQSLKMKQRS
jgi:hypothetical protein